MRNLKINLLKFSFLVFLIAIIILLENLILNYFFKIPNTNAMIDFNKMIAEFLQDTATWQWWVSQSFALVSIIFCTTAMQQKNTTDILWHRTIYSLLIFAGGCFLGKLPAIIMMGVALIRNIILLILSYKTKISKVIKNLIFTALAASLVALNIIFWENYLSILSIALGLAYLIAFIQSKPINVRRMSIVGASISIVFYILVFSPTNALINIAVLISSIVGLYRLDRHKNKVSEVSAVEQANT